MKRATPPHAPQPAFEQNIVALVWDFDKTLISGYMQSPLFRRLGIPEERFWDEVKGLHAWYKARGVQINNDTIYLNHLLTWIDNGPLAGLCLADLHAIGAELEYYPGLPDFLPEIKQRIEKNPAFAKYDIKLEHYIVSTGFAETIRGSKVAAHVAGIWGCEFIEAPAPVGYLEGVEPPNVPPQLRQVAVALDNTSKTRALFEISKGANKVDSIDVNSKIRSDSRRVPFEHMLYIADGPSDVPAFSILNQFGGHTYAIYPEGERNAFQQVDQLRQDGRIDMFGPADYREGTQTWMWLTDHVEHIAQKIATEKVELIKRAVSAPPRHL